LVATAAGGCARPGNGGTVVEEAAAALERRHQAHHHEVSPEERRRNVRDLFELVVQCVHEGRAEPIIALSQQIAANRFEAGFDIAEIQGTFNVLEEVLWRHVAGTLADDQRIEALGLVNTILGAGRDALARTYVALASRRAGPLDQQPAASRGDGEAGGPAGAAGLADGAVRTDRRGQVGVIALDNQRTRNALSAQTANGIVAALESLRAEGVRAARRRDCASGRPAMPSTNFPVAGATRWATTIRSNNCSAPSAPSRFRSSPWCTARCGAERSISCSAATWSSPTRRRRSLSLPQTWDCLTTPPGCSTFSGGCPSI
jgi:hypothetical protein